MYEYLKRSDVGWKVKKSKPQEEGYRFEKKEQKLTGYEPTTKEKKEGEEPEQRSQIENSYGQVSLGVSKSGNMTLVISGKKEKDQTPVDGEKKQIEGDRLTRKSRTVYAGNRGASESVLVYRGNVETASKKRWMLNRIRKVLDEEPSEVVSLQMPFLNIQRDEKRLSALNKATSGHIQKEFDRQKEELAREIQIKQKLRRDMMRNLTASVEKEERMVRESDFNALQWLHQFMAGADAGLSGKDEGSEEETENEK